MTLSNSAKFLETTSVARSVRDSWASCKYRTSRFLGDQSDQRLLNLTGAAFLPLIRCRRATWER